LLSCGVFPGLHNKMRRRIDEPEAKAEDSTKIPVVVLPPQLTFSDSENSHKQVLTVYNPFNAPLQFKVLSTFPALYLVQPAHGTLAAKSSLNIIVRLKPNEARPRERDRKSDRFLVELFDERNGVRGSSVVPVLHVHSASGSAAGNGHSGEKRLAGTSVAGTGADARGGSASGSGSDVQLQPQSGFGSFWYSTGRLLPLLLGLALMALLAHGVFRIDPYALLWIAFCIGMITMFLQAKFLDQGARR